MIFYGIKSKFETAQISASWQGVIEVAYSYVFRGKPHDWA
jgi:hypothetical protein